MYITHMIIFLMLHNIASQSAHFFDTATENTV